MNAEQAWDHFVQQVMNVAAGIEEPTRAVAAGKLYAAHAVAEARAPLVEALRPFAEAKVSYSSLSNEVGYDHYVYAECRESDIRRAAAALAKETP